VHFLSFPEAEILSCQDEETGKTLFFQSLKEVSASTAAAT